MSGKVEKALDFLQCNIYYGVMYDDRKCARTQKKKMGRPRLGPLAKRANFTLRVHEDDLALWRKLAAERGMTITDFILGPLRKSLARRKAK